MATEETEQDLLSFTVDEDGNVLELIKATAEGELLFRDNGHWVVMNAEDEYPTIYDQELLDVGSTHIEEAISLWDGAQSTDEDITGEDVLDLTALVE